MVSGGLNKPELEDPPSFKSPVWEHFGFAVDGGMKKAHADSISLAS